jgi:hypothetical protein
MHPLADEDNVLSLDDNLLSLDDVHRVVGEGLALREVHPSRGESAPQTLKPKS